ncbi:MAG TPA: hypothetical protein VJS92_06790 [Candidatus Polarisedimenticolaceae bacterium]|nr:hypothetical protein [Candidatus Polarisedimenticolaceae bacterium]
MAGRGGGSGTALTIGFLAVLAAFLSWRMFMVSPVAEEGRLVPRSQRGFAYLLWNGDRYLLGDKDRDDRVDCLVRTGLGGAVGYANLRAAGDYRCGQIGALNRPMPEPLRAELTELLRLKLATDTAHVSSVAPGCWVSVHAPQIVVWRGPEAACSGDTRRARTLGDAQQEPFAQLAALEARVRAALETTR